MLAALLVVAVPLAAASCGGSTSSRHERSATTQDHITYVGQAQRIVTVSPAGGPAFSVFGQRYRFGGGNYVEEQLRFAEPWRVGLQSAGGWGAESASLTDEQGIEVHQGCQVHPFAVIYGPLENSHDSLFAQTPNGTVRLAEIAIPPSLHMAGAFFYGTTRSMPTGLIVRGRSSNSAHHTEIHLMESTGSPEGPPCSGGEEPRWVQTHVAQTKAPTTLAKITQCLRHDGFEAGTQPANGFLPGTQRWRRYEAARNSCRRKAIQAAS